MSLVVAFDADDTLWHNEGAFAEVEQLFNETMAPWADAETAETTLLRHERARLDTWGYGVKSFALSMIAAAHELAGEALPPAVVMTFVDAADRLLSMPTVLLDGAREVLTEVSGTYPTMILTKGDLHHQLRRIAEVDISHYCFDIEVVAEKDPATYRRIAKRHGIDPTRLVMVGNSIVSDVAPVLEIGARAIHIPYETTWALETADEDPPDNDRWVRLDTIQGVPDVLASMAGQAV